MIYKIKFSLKKYINLPNLENFHFILKFQNLWQKILSCYLFFTLWFLFFFHSKCLSLYMYIYHILCIWISFILSVCMFVNACGWVCVCVCIGMCVCVCMELYLNNRIKNPSQCVKLRRHLSRERIGLRDKRMQVSVAQSQETHDCINCINSISAQEHLTHSLRRWCSISDEMTPISSGS